MATTAKQYIYPKTVTELEQEIFNSSDSDTDIEFSFLKRGKSKKTALTQTKGNENTEQIEEDAPMFVLDRVADEKIPADQLESISNVDKIATADKPKSKKRSQKDVKNLKESLLKVPTELQVQDEPLAESATSSSVQSEILKKAVVTTGFEKRHAVPTYSEGRKAMSRKRREEKATTKAGWFDMRAPEMTEELEADVEAIQMRSSAASWTGYKKADYKKGPKFFQIATVEDSPLDYYHSRVPKKARKRTIVDELLADADFRRTNKKIFMKAKEKLDKRHPNKKGGRHKKSK